MNAIFKNKTILALTGPIAAGKSTVSEYFRSKTPSIPTIDADKIAKDLREPGALGFIALVNHFGQNILDQKGHIDKEILSTVLFLDEQAHLHQQWIQHTFHPLIRDAVENKINDIFKKNPDLPGCLVALPLFNNRSDYPYCSGVIAVLASQENQLERLISKRNFTEEHAEAIMNAQPDLEHYKNISSEIINNNQDLAYLDQQLDLIYQKYFL